MRIISGSYKNRRINFNRLQARPPTDFAKESLFNLLNNDYDLICGSRFLKGGSSNTYFRHFCSKIFNFFVNLITGGKLSDNLSGFFIIKKIKLSKILGKTFYGYGEFYIRLLYYMQKNNLPPHPLFEKGYSTIGDWHSSAPDSKDAVGRQTRFGGLKQECGIHVSDKDQENKEK